MSHADFTAPPPRRCKLPRRRRARRLALRAKDAPGPREGPSGPPKFDDAYIADPFFLPERGPRASRKEARPWRSCPTIPASIICAAKRARCSARAAPAIRPPSRVSLRPSLGDEAAASCPLSRAQTCIAREYGLPSWPKLVAEVEGGAPRRPPNQRATPQSWPSGGSRWPSSTDLRPLNRALAVGKARKEAARAVMQRDAARYAAFQRALVRGLDLAPRRERFECAARARPVRRRLDPPRARPADGRPRARACAGWRCTPSPATPAARSLARSRRAFASASSRRRVATRACASANTQPPHWRSRGETSADPSAARAA